MSKPLTESGAPSIEIALGGTGPRVRQRRPAVVATLAGMSVARALRLVPTLLPICGQAQSQAAWRAVEAASGRAESVAERALREQQLWREQAFAAAWRLCVDWPDLLGEARCMTELGAVHRAVDDAARAAALAELLPGLDSVSSLDQLHDWVRRGDCQAARVARLALAAPSPLAGVEWLRGEALVRCAGHALQQPDFDALEPGAGRLEVGPLAMCREPLIAALQEELGASVPARLLAQVLDTRLICRALAGTGNDDPVDADSWRLGDGIGLGRAVTSRGPVFHRVQIGPGEDSVVLDWRVLAPTDWHFSSDGPVAAALAGIDDPAVAKRLVTSFDPCAPWTLRAIGQEA